MDTVETPTDEIPLIIFAEVMIPVLLIFEEVTFVTVILGDPLKVSAVDAIPVTLPVKLPKNPPKEVVAPET